MDRCISGLEQEQPVRRALDPESAEKIDAFIKLLLEKRTLKSTFTMVLLLKQTTGFLFAKHCLVQVIDDPSGNSYIENPNAPHADPAMKVTQYFRNKDQNHLVGIYEEELKDIAEEEDEEANGDLSGEKLEGEVLCFGTNCPSCNAPCETNMKVTSKSQIFFST